MKSIKHYYPVIVALLILLAALSSCAGPAKKTPLHMIILPKFEVGEITGDFPGEAQLFYERYCEGCEEVEIPNMPPTAKFFVNEDTGVGLLVTGSGKLAAGLSLMSLLSSDLYDYSDAYIVSVGCGGGSVAYSTPGDVIVVTAACDYDLGHHVDTHEKKNKNNRVMWFPDDDYSEYEHKLFDPELADKTFRLIRDCPLQTTELVKTTMKENFPPRGEEEILPAVKKGTALTGDNYWKGIYGHVTANYIANYYKCPDPYMVTEMEEVAVASTAECFGMLDRVISLRVIVNMDVFLNDETPESTWGEYDSYNRKISDENPETLEIFEPAMHNLFDTASIVIDKILEGEFN